MSLITIGEPRTLRTSNTVIYWGFAIMTLIFVTLLFSTRKSSEIRPMIQSNQAVAQDSQQLIDPATGRVYRVDPETGAIVEDPNGVIYNNSRIINNPYNFDETRMSGSMENPRSEELHNGANSTNGGIGD